MSEKELNVVRSIAALSKLATMLSFKISHLQAENLLLYEILADKGIVAKDTPAKIENLRMEAKPTHAEIEKALTQLVEALDGSNINDE